jgi:hypothetical protein
VQSDDCRDLQRAGEDGGVVRAAPGVHRKPAHAGPIDLGSHGRRQLIGDEHERPVDMAQPGVGRDGALPEVHEEAPHDVFDVPLPLPQVRVLDRIEQLLDFLERTMDGPLGIDAFVADQGQRAPQQHRIVENEQLCFEQWRELSPQALTDPGRDAFELHP